MAALPRQRNFDLLWIASSISLLGTWALRIALPVGVLRRTGSAADVAVVSAASLLGGVAVGWAAGGWVDRWDRRRVLVWGNAVQALVVLVLSVPGAGAGAGGGADVGAATGIGLVVAVAAVESAVAQFLQPAENALVPRLVGADQVSAANAWLAVSSNAARLAGPVLGGLIAAAGGLAGAAVVDAVTFALAAVLCAGITGRHRAEADVEADVEAGYPRSGLMRDVRLGWVRLWRTPTVRAILLLLAVSGFGDGVMGSTQAVFATRVLHGDARLLGAMTSAQAVGGILSGLAATRWIGRALRVRPSGPEAPCEASRSDQARVGSRAAQPRAGRRPTPTQTIGLCFAALGIVDLAIAVYPRWSGAAWPAVVLFGLAGVPVGVHVGLIWTLFQAAAEDHLRGRFFATIWTAASLTAAAGALAAGALTAGAPGGALSVPDVMLVPGASGLAAAVLFVSVTRDPGRAAPDESDADR